MWLSDMRWHCGAGLARARAMLTTHLVAIVIAALLVAQLAPPLELAKALGLIKQI